MYTRYRFDGSLTASSVPLHETFYYSNGTTSVVTGTSYQFGETRICNDVLVPQFHSKVKEGVIFNNPFNSVKEWRSGTAGSRVGVYTHVPAPVPPSVYINKIVRESGNNGNWFGSQIVGELPIDVDSLILEASTKARSNVEKPEVEGLPILGELHQTIQLLRNPLSALTEFVRKGSFVKGGNYRRRDAAKALADQHLAFAFGVKPLMRDVEDVLKSLFDTRAKSKRKTVRGFSFASNSSLATRTYNDGTVSGVLTDRKTRTVSIRAGSLYDVDIDLGLSKWGLSISDIPSAVWELTPFSFVVDWVSNLQDYISAITPKFGIRTLAEWYTVRDIWVCNTSLGTTLTSLNPDYTYSGGGDTRTRVVLATTRVPANLGELTGVVFKPGLNTNQVFLSLSLLTQQLSRIKPDNSIPKALPFGLKKHQKVWQFYAH